jgi:glycolate oxidase FAD binding subunit
MLTLRLAGARAAVEAAEKKFAGEKVGAGGTAPVSFWDELRDQRLPFFSDPAPLWRLSLPSVAPVLDLPGETLIEWGGAQRWLRSAAPAETIRAAATKVGGSATAFHCDAALKATAGGAFAPLPAPLMNLHRRMKAAFDPRGILNPGRLYPEF